MTDALHKKLSAAIAGFEKDPTFRHKFVAHLVDRFRKHAQETTKIMMEENFFSESFDLNRVDGYGGYKDSLEAAIKFLAEVLAREIVENFDYSDLGIV